jgi:riboflavin-specific deaminase-like protein
MLSQSAIRMNLNQKIERWLTKRKNLFTSEIRPFVTLAYAQSLDGSISTRRGKSISISGTESIQLTHQLRSLHDGILVGIETVITDDPQLTARDWKGENPQPVVLDSLLRMPKNARLCHHPDKQCWVLSVTSRSEDIVGNFKVLTLKNEHEKRVPLDSALQLLKDKGITSLMIEGGATVITAFLKAGLVDAIILTIATKFVGGYKAVNDLEPNNMMLFPNVDPMFSEILGKDIIIWGDINFGESES